MNEQVGWTDVSLEPLRRFVPLAAGLTAIGAMASDPGTPVEVLAGLVAVVPFLVWAFVWRAMPTVLIVASTAALELVALRSGEMEPLLFVMCLAVTVVGGWEPSTRMVVAGGLLAAATPVVSEALYPNGVLYGVWWMGIALSLLLPRGFRWQLALVTQLAQAREELTRQASLDEKRAIARDVHDLVGHGLAAMLLHVTGARHVLRRDPGAAEEALVEAEAVGRRSLQELRRTIGALRSGDGTGIAGAGPSPARGAATAAGRRADGVTAPPLPRIDELDAVVGTVRAAGVDVALRTEGDLARVDPIVGLSLHRVAEEALANARQHAPAAVTDVLVRVDDGEVMMTVDSTGPLRAPDPDDADRPRYGLVGMRERMAAVGGDLEAGPTSTGWRVRCQAPLDRDPAPARAVGEPAEPVEPAGAAQETPG